MGMDREGKGNGTEGKRGNGGKNKLAPHGTDGRLFVTDVSANFKVT